jgi:predicted secreted hydrolase
VWELRWVDQRFAFNAIDDRAGFAFALETRPEKPLVFQGPNGYSRKGNGQTAASLYYSFTRLGTSGTVTIDGKEYTIGGESWMDKEFGSNQLTGDQVGWDWFSLRLNDGRDVMLYQLRDRDGITDFARATVVSPQGTPRFQGGDAWDVEVLDTWRSPTTDAEYPIRWRIGARDDGVSFVVTAEFPDQENVSRLIPGLFYWEGSVVVSDDSGRPLGVGYVELTGYGTAAPPAI